MRAHEVGPYRLESSLGQGGMGAVWRAWDGRLKRPVAIKHVLPEALGSSGARQQFRREAEAGARLNHPAIVHIYDIVETPEGDWIVMELVEGESLRQRLKAGPLDPLQAVALGLDLAEGLAEAHGRGIIHRDLKSSNVMLTPAGRAKILDFGIAKVWSPDQEATLSAAGLVVGTCHAMSPEQALGLPLDPRSDLFSLGSLLYEALTGTAVFLGPTPAATLSRVCHFRPEPLAQARPEVPRDLSDLVEALMEKDPAHRPRSAQEAAARLRRIGAAGTSLPPPEILSPTPWEPPAELALPTLVEPSGAPGVPASGFRRAGEEEGATLRSRATPRSTRKRLLLVLAILALLGIGLVLPAWLGERPLSLLPGSYGPYREASELLARYDRPGNVNQAIEILEAVLARDGDSAPALAALARAYWRQYLGDSKDPVWLRRALPLAQRAVQVEPYLASARVSLGLVLGSQGRSEEAIRELKQALALDPLDADAHDGLGKVLASQGKLAEAEQAYRKAFELRPDRETSDDLGTLLLRMGRTGEAVAAFRRSVALAPDSVLSHRNLGGAYYLQGKLPEAAAELQKALQISPHASIYSNLGTIYFAQGFYADAAEAFDRALHMPGAANNYLLWANLADAYRWLPGRKADARDAYLRAVQLLRERLQSAPGDPVLRSRLALYLAKRGDREQALAEIAKAEPVTGKDASGWFRLTVASEICGERDRALAALARALDAGCSLEEVRGDPELLKLREDLRYHRLMAAAESADTRKGGAG